jgi:hypothetical protein
LDYLKIAVTDESIYVRKSAEESIEAVKLMGVGLNLYFFEFRFPRLAF